MRNEMVAQPAHARDRAIARANRRPNALSVCFLAKALPRTRPARDAPPLERPGKRVEESLVSAG